MKIPNLKERLSTRFKADIPVPSLMSCRCVRSQVVDNETQVVSETLEFKSFNRSDEMKPYRCSDFSLHNLLAIDAPLNDVKLQSSALRCADNLVNVLDSIPESVFENTNL